MDKIKTISYRLLLFFILYLVSYASTTYGGIDDGLVAYYPFNGNANDESGNGNHGTVNGATLAVDKNGTADSAYSFDGVDDYVDCGYDASLNPGTGDISVVAWIKTTQSSRGEIVEKGHDVQNVGYNLGVYPDYKAHFGKMDGLIVGSSSTVNDGEWHHIVGLKAGNYFKVYIDGTFDNEVSGADNLNLDSDHGLLIGTRRANACPFNGTIDDIRIYNRTLSESEIQTLYGGTATTPPTITEISPLLGSKAGGTEVTITGTDFQNGATVKFGDNNATSVTFNNSTELKATTPNITGNTPISVTVRVTNPDEQYADFATQFEYLTPVWPGDTNNDGTIDQNDVPPIGTYWGLTGPARTNASIQWTEQLTSDWTDASTTYVDASGNGKIDQGDVLRIGYNWAETNSNYNPAPALIALNGKHSHLPPLKAIAPSVVKPDERFTVQIRLGEAAVPIENLFGVAFRLQNRLPQMVKAVEATPDSLLGNNLVFFQHIDENEGHVSVGMTKKRGQKPAQGSGTVANIDFMASKKAKLGTRVSLAFTDAAVNNPTGERILVNPQSTDFVIGYFGDVTCDTKIDSSDAREILQMIVSDSSSYEKEILADVSGDGIMSPFDAVLILQRASGMRSSFPAEVGEAAMAPELPRSPNLSIPVAAGKVRQNISVPVEIDATGLMFGQVNISFDSKLLKVRSVTQGEMIQAGELAYHVEGDELNIAFANPKAVEGKGVLFNIAFEITNALGIASDASFTLTQARFNGVVLPIQLTGQIHLLPSETRLLHNYPNPFNPDTWIPYQLAADASDVSIVIYNIGGQIVRTLRLGSRPAGMYLSKERAAHWDGRNQQGERAASGIYIYHFRADDYQAIGKMVVRK